jgi:hypothetical protein
LGRCFGGKRSRCGTEWNDHCHLTANQIGGQRRQSIGVIPVMGAVQPRFQVCEDEMDDWQILLGDLRIAAFGDGEVFVAALGEARVAAPVVSDERRARHNGTLDEAAERLRASVRHDGEPNTPGIATTLPLVELGTGLR